MSRLHRRRSCAWASIILPFVLPCLLANNSLSVLLGFVLFFVIFGLAGHLMLTLLGGGAARYSAPVAFVFGLGFVTTAYDALARAGMYDVFIGLIAAFSIVGLLLLFRSRIGACKPVPGLGFDDAALLAGALTSLCIAPLFWFSGRFYGGTTAFYGPVGQSGFMHLSLVQRLLDHVPPDNFVFAGLSPPFYHYLSDQALALILRVQETPHVRPATLLDVCLRCYPSILYFLLGALAYRAGRTMLGSSRGGILAVLLLLGAGGLTWIFGFLRIAVQFPDPTGLRLALFPEWTGWDGIGSIRSLVSRPAEFNGMLFCLAAVNILLRADRTRQDWIVAGLLLGLMAGFNYTLAATLGAAALFACVVLFLMRQYDEARDLIVLAIALFVGAIPANLMVLSVGVSHIVQGAPLGGPHLDLPTAIWSNFLGHFLPPALVPGASLVVFPVVAYGIRLFGLRALAQGDIAGLAHRGVGMMLAAAFVVSFTIGTFFTFGEIGGAPAEKILLQPTLWMLSLFSLRPILSWLECGRGVWRAAALWGMLGLTWMQSLVALDFTQKVAFSADSVAALNDIRSLSSPEDVVAYLPIERVGTPLLGEPQRFADFAITAISGLDGYFSNETLSLRYAMAGLDGRTAPELLDFATALYRQRMNDLDSYLKGDADAAAIARLSRERVRWIVLSQGAPRAASPVLKPWRQNEEISVYRVSP